MTSLLRVCLLLMALLVPVRGEPGLKQVDAAALQAVFDQTARELGVPGALALLRTPQGEVVLSYGTTELGQSIPPTAATHFRIASNTKTMTAAVILLLAQEGRLQLTDPVEKFVSGVPAGDRITVAQLLSMRSGLANYTQSPALADALDRHPARTWTPREVLALAFAQPAHFAPGAEFEYCNTNYALLGLIAEKLEGCPLAAIFQARLFQPLGMQSTLLPGPVLPNPFSHGYMYGGSAFALVDKPYPPGMGQQPPHDYTLQNASYATAAGGAVSTARDLAIWIEALVDGRVLNTPWQRRFLTDIRPQDPAAPQGQGYGYGLTRLTFGGNRLYFHGGELPGFNSFIGRDPANQMTLVVWTNLTLSLDGQTTANTLMLKLLDQLYAESPLH